MNPAKIFKILLVVFLITILIIAGLGVGVYHFFPRNRVLGILKSLSEDTLKTRVDIHEIDYSLKGIVLRKIFIYNKADNDAGVLSSAEEAIVRFSLLKLIFEKKFDVTFVFLDTLRLNISFDREGKSNLTNLIKHLSKGDESPGISTRIDTISLKNANIALVNPHDEVLKPLAGNYIVNGSIEFKKNSRYTITDCRIILPEKRGVVIPEIVLSVKENDFVISGDVNLEKCSLLWVYTWGKNLALPYHDVSGKVRNLKITSKSVEGFLKGVSNLSNKLPLVLNGFCRVGIPDKRVFLSNIQASIQTTSFLIDDFLFNFRGDILKFKIRNIEAQISDVLPILSFLPDTLSGEVKGELSLENKKYSGTLSTNVNYGKKGSIIKDFQTRVILKDNIIAKTHARFTFLNSPIDAYIATGDGNFRNIQMDIAAKSIEYVPETKNKTQISYKPLRLPVEANGKITLDSLKVDQVRISNIAIHYRYNNGQLSIEPLTFALLGGDFKGTGDIALAQKDPRVRFSMNFTNLKMQNATKTSEKFKDRFFGTAGGKADLSFTINKDFNFYDSMEGKVEFSINNGKLVNTGIQNGLGIWLSELKYKLRDLEFSRIYGNIIISGSNYTINSFVFNAQDIRLRMDGAINRQLAGDLKIFLEFTGNFIQDLPNPVYLQLGKYKKGRWYVIPFVSRGKDVTDSKNLTRID